MEICSVFEARFPNVAAERYFPFSAHTTIGCGGTAALAVSPVGAEETAEILTFFRSEGIPFCFLGAGANVLPKDGFWNGAVIRFRRMRRLSLDGTAIYAESGVTGGELLRFAKENLLGGFEPFAGIPMTVGGGTAMNAGIREKHFSDIVSKVVGIECGKIREFTARECDFSEKNSIFLSGIAIVGVYLNAVPSTPKRISQNCTEYLKRRRNLPKGKSMGCTFVNPEGRSAGQIIDECGLKGLSVGSARVSEQHANFILNEGSSSADVAQLIELVKEEVRRKTGIVLREEIRRIP